MSTPFQRRKIRPSLELSFFNQLLNLSKNKPIYYNYYLVAYDHPLVRHIILDLEGAEAKIRLLQTEESQSSRHIVMGFPSFSGVSAGLLVIINTVVSVQSFKDIVKSFMEILGLFFTTTSAHDTHTQLNLNTYRSTAVAESPSSNRSRYLESPVMGSELAQLPFIAEEIRENLPVVPYQSTANTHVGECAVCLSKFEEEDQIRELPCCHLFHRICLDKWLDHQQTTCPLCRSSLIPEETANRLRRREQELTEELMFWFSSFHGHGFHSMWWLRV